MSTHLSRALIGEFAEHLRKTMPELREVIEHWPDPGQGLRMPCASIYGFSPQVRHFRPYVINQAELDAATGDQFAVKYAVAWYDLTLQVDLWTDSREDQHEIFEAFFQSMNSQFPVPGLSLTLSDYHDQIARYDYDAVEFREEEGEMTRMEFRTRATILSQCVAVMERDENLIKEGEISFNTFRADSDTTSVT